MFHRLMIPAIAIAIAFSRPATAVQLYPSDDMYSDPNHGGMPNTITELWCANFSGAGHYERIMIKFDQDELSALGAEVNVATLDLDRFFGCPAHPYTSAEVFAGTQDWDEDTWPVTQHLPHEDLALASVVFGPTNGWYTIDITDLVNSWISGERDNCGLVIQARTGEKWSKFYSKDHGSVGMRPFLTVETGGVGVPDVASMHRLRCAPNPFNPRTTIRFSLPTTGPATVRVFAADGHLVRTLVDHVMPAGDHAIDWDGRDRQGRPAAAGAYVVRLEHGHGRAATRASLVK
jgi:hypothetical protein